MLNLQVGKFYKDRQGKVWCCFDIFTNIDGEIRMECILVRDSDKSRAGGRIESFWCDGRYDVGGTREHCLVKEVRAPGRNCSTCDKPYQKGETTSYPNAFHKCRTCKWQQGQLHKKCIECTEQED